MILKNISKKNIEEFFYGHGYISLLSKETKEIPDEIAELWLDPRRQEVIVEQVKANSSMILSIEDDEQL